MYLKKEKTVQVADILSVLLLSVRESVRLTGKEMQKIEHLFKNVS